MSETPIIDPMVLVRAGIEDASLALEVTVAGDVPHVTCPVCLLVAPLHREGAAGEAPVVPVAAIASGYSFVYACPAGCGHTAPVEVLTGEDALDAIDAHQHAVDQATAEAAATHAAAVEADAKAAAEAEAEKARLVSSEPLAITDEAPVAPLIAGEPLNITDEQRASMPPIGDPGTDAPALGSSAAPIDTGFVAVDEDLNDSDEESDTQTGSTPAPESSSDAE